MAKIKIPLLIIGFLVGSCYLFSDEPASLAGKWKFNAKESDNPHDKFQKARTDENGDSHYGHEQSGGWHHGDHERSGKGGHHFEPPASLEITFKDSEFKFKDDKGNVRSYFVDGRKSQYQVDENRTISYTSKWENDSLVVQSISPSGNNTTESYYLSPDRKKMYVKLQMPAMMSDQSISIIRVYDFMAGLTSE